MSDRLSPDALHRAHLAARHAALDQRLRATQQAMRVMAQAAPGEGKSRTELAYALHESIHECNELVVALLAIAHELDRSFGDA